MSYTSFSYLLFTAATVVLYYLVPKKYQWSILLVFSYVFYILAGPKMIVFLLLSTFTTYSGALFIRKLESGIEDCKRKIRFQRAIIVSCLLINFGVLFLFKYLDITLRILNRISGFQFPAVNWALPLGISFYTFQSLGYLIDVYWKRIDPERSLPKHMLFVSFYPQILQGPIGRYSSLGRSLFEEHSFSLLNVQHGIQRILWGYFLKFVIADHAGLIVNTVIGDPKPYGGSVYLFTILMYSLQLYGDFAGGCDVVIGTAELFGITMDENFKRPYFSVSITDFWHRWHITLGTWMKDYLFYPLSVSKWMMRLGKRMRKRFGRRTGTLASAAIANVIVFLAVGVWHGAGGKYLLYGFYNGIIIALEMMLEPSFRNLHNRLHISPDSKGLHIWRIIRTFLLVNLSWFFDVCTDLFQSFYMLGRVFTNFHLKSLTDGTLLLLGLNWKGYIAMLFGVAVLLIKSVIEERGKDVRALIDNESLPLRWIVYFGMLFAVLILGQYSNSGFIYAQF